MTDRELLELAAKAAGIELWPGDAWRMITPRFSGLLLKDGATIWNPLTDDGDALRLAVKVGRMPELIRDGSGVFCGYETKRNCHSPIIEKFGDDRMAAIRRAIVRAAAEVYRNRTTEEA